MILVGDGVEAAPTYANNGWSLEEGGKGQVFNTRRPDGTFLAAWDIGTSTHKSELTIDVEDGLLAF